uniref:F-box domain-containing protein n=2 Tax=Aegilops tauschii TaxID=37682 RepID=M8CSA0_AEGTA
MATEGATWTYQGEGRVIERPTRIRQPASRFVGPKWVNAIKNKAWNERSILRSETVLANWWRGTVGFSGASMHLRWGPRRRSPRLLARGGGLDLISDLPDDLLLLVLAGLPCVSAAARTEVLSRRWRSLWARLGQIVFSDVPFHSLEAVLGRLPRPIPVLSLLEIRFPNERLPWPIPEEHLVDAASVNSLLRAAARLEPEEFEFELPANLLDGPLIVDLPCFHRATSILLDLHPVGVILRVPAGVEFPALEELHLWACTVDIDALLSCSPRLRTLCLSNVYSDSDDDLVVSATVAVSSTSLQELVLRQTDWMDGVNIVAPVLKQLTVSFSATRLNPLSKRINKVYIIARKVAENGSV